MNRTRFRNTVLGIGATAAAIALGYFGVGITVPKRENCTLRLKVFVCLDLGR